MGDPEIMTAEQFIPAALDWLVMQLKGEGTYVAIADLRSIMPTDLRKADLGTLAALQAAIRLKAAATEGDKIRKWSARSLLKQRLLRQLYQPRDSSGIPKQRMPRIPDSVTKELPRDSPTDIENQPEPKNLPAANAIVAAQSSVVTLSMEIDECRADFRFLTALYEGIDRYINCYHIATMPKDTPTEKP